MQLPNDIDLPDNAVAEIRQTSLLGEKFVSLSPPETDPSPAPLSDGDVIELADTGRNPEVEEVLGALSLVLNGGGVAQLKTIASELNQALEGREDAAKSVFRQTRTLMRQLAALRERIDAAGLKTIVQIDGGITDENAEMVARDGADSIVAGSGVFRHPKLSPSDAIAALRAAAGRGIAVRRGAARSC